MVTCLQWLYPCQAGAQIPSLVVSCCFIMFRYLLFAWNQTKNHTKFVIKEAEWEFLLISLACRRHYLVVIPHIEESKFCTLDIRYLVSKERCYTYLFRSFFHFLLAFINSFIVYIILKILKANGVCLFSTWSSNSLSVVRDEAILNAVSIGWFISLVEYLSRSHYRLAGEIKIRGSFLWWFSFFIEVASFWSSLDWPSFTQNIYG